MRPYRSRSRVVQAVFAAAGEASLAADEAADSREAVAAEVFHAEVPVVSVADRRIARMGVTATPPMAHRTAAIRRSVILARAGASIPNSRAHSRPIHRRR